MHFARIPTDIRIPQVKVDNPNTGKTFLLKKASLTDTSNNLVYHTTGMAMHMLSMLNYDPDQLVKGRLAFS